MGSPITTWEGAEAVFTGAGGFTPGLLLIASVIVVAYALIQGAKHESEAYDKIDG